MRNPLNVASGYTEVFKKEYGDEDFDPVTTAQDRTEQIIEELLLLARSGQLIDEPATVSLSDLVDRCWSNVETERAHLGVVDTAQIVADPNRLQHLFENRFRNAVEHGGSDVTVRVGRLKDGFYTDDEGPGIPGEDREPVVQDGYTTKREGTGFGLVIVSQIAKVHGWELRVTEGIDGGARFEITGVDFAPSAKADTAA